MVGTVIELVTLKLAIMFLVAYSGGLLVELKGVKVNYTRKINHFFLFFVPSFADYYFLGNSPGELTSSLNEGLFSASTFLCFVHPVRKRFTVMRTAFSSFDRPEDRPHTLFWYTSQVIAGYLVVLPMIYLYEANKMLDLLSIQVLIGVFGDGLAEPVGIRFGKHKYPTKPLLFGGKKYVRTLEGSAMVFIVSIVVLFFFQGFFSAFQFFIALATVPITMTLAEAVSPHTWDDPLMIAAGSLLVFSIKKYC